MGTASEGATLISLADKGGATEFVVVGLGGDFQLARRKSSPASVQTPVVLEASDAVLATLDGRSVTSEATLSVRSHGGSFNRLTVRLPPEASFCRASPTITA